MSRARGAGKRDKQAKREAQRGIYKFDAAGMAELQRLKADLRRSTRITGADLAVRINARDDDPRLSKPMTNRGAGKTVKAWTVRAWLEICLDEERACKPKAHDRPPIGDIGTRHRLFPLIISPEGQVRVIRGTVGGKRGGKG